MRGYAVFNMRLVRRTLRAITPLFAILCSLHAVHAQMSPNERAGNTLFQLYDTVASMKSALIPADPETPPGDEFHNSARLSALELYLALAKSPPSTIADLERSYPYLLLGARDSNLFDPPHGDAFGAILAHEAFIAISHSTTQPDLERDFPGTPSEIIDGRKVWALPALDDRHPEWGSFYATQIDTRYFVVALGRDDFLKIVRTLTAAGEPTRPASINAWQTFHPHEFWIYRTVRGSGDRAHNPFDDGMDALHLSAFVFYADLDQPAGTLEVWSADRNASSPPKLNSLRTYFTLMPLSRGVWQANIPFKVDDNNRDVFFVLFSMFGFSVVL